MIVGPELYRPLCPGCGSLHFGVGCPGPTVGASAPPLVIWEPRRGELGDRPRPGARYNPGRSRDSRGLVVHAVRGVRLVDDLAPWEWEEQPVPARAALMRA